MRVFSSFLCALGVSVVDFFTTSQSRAAFVILCVFVVGF